MADVDAIYISHTTLIQSSQVIEYNSSKYFVAYCFVSGHGNILAVKKSTDNGFTWVLQDIDHAMVPTNDPTITASPYVLGAYYPPNGGSIIYLYAMLPVFGGNGISLQTYDMSTDTFGTVIGGGPTTSEDWPIIWQPTYSGNGVIPNGLSVNTDTGVWILVYAIANQNPDTHPSGLTELLLFTTYSVTAGWDVFPPTLASSADAQLSILTTGRDINGITHVVYGIGASDDYYVNISPSGPSTPIIIFGLGDVNSGWGKPTYDSRTDTIYFPFTYQTGSNSYVYVAAGTPSATPTFTISLIATYAGDTTIFVSGQPVIVINPDHSLTLLYLLSDIDSPLNSYYSTNSGSGWSEPSLYYADTAGGGAGFITATIQPLSNPPIYDVLYCYPTAATVSATFLAQSVINTCPTSPTVIDVPYTSSVSTNQGVPPVVYSISSGELPPGLIMDSDGAITGIPIQPGDFAFSWQATDSTGSVVATDSCYIDVIEQAACPSSFAVVGVAYSSPITTDNGVPPYTYTITSGSLPPGLTLNATTGVISGIPTTAGTYDFSGTVTDSNDDVVAIVNCAIIVLTSYPTKTLRFEIPKKRWFYHQYNDPCIATHYLDEVYPSNVDKQQLLLVSNDQGAIYAAGGNTDANGVSTQGEFLSEICTPSLDGGDDRIQKLYVDVMTDMDQADPLYDSLIITPEYNNQSIVGTPVTVTTDVPRTQMLTNISSLSNLNLYRNIALDYQWYGGPVGPRLYITEPAGYAQPYISTFMVTQIINLAFPGWKHHRRLYAGYISNSPLLFTILTQDGRTYGPITLPTTNGIFAIKPIMLPQAIKDLAFGYQIDGQGQNFALFAEAFTVETKEWREPEYINLAIFRT